MNELAKQTTANTDQQVGLVKHSPLHSQPDLLACQKLRLAILVAWPSRDSKNVSKHNFYHSNELNRTMQIKKKRKKENVLLIQNSTRKVIDLAQSGK